jgi:hypothetical protein
LRLPNVVSRMMVRVPTSNWASVIFHVGARVNWCEPYEALYGANVVGTRTNYVGSIKSLVRFTPVYSCTHMEDYACPVAEPGELVLSQTEGDVC